LKETSDAANFSPLPKVVDVAGCSYENYNITETTEDSSNTSLQQDVTILEDEEEEQEESKNGIQPTF
jgi:hypothetical protein